MIIRIEKGEIFKRPNALKSTYNGAMRIKQIQKKLDDEIASEMEEPVYDTLKDRFDAETQIRENEGKGVRLALSNESVQGNGNHQQTRARKREPYTQLSNCSDYGLKKSLNESQGKIIYPTPEDMANKQDNIFFQMFTAYTEKYVKEEGSKEQMHIRR